jgi:UTP-glucose-1-phosphate uridylyltransferase
LLELVEAYQQHKTEIVMSIKEAPVEELMSRSSVDVDANWRVRRIVEKPTSEEILGPYAASIMLILPPAIWDYLPKVRPSQRGEIEMQSAVQMMIDDGYKTLGLLQPAPKEWRPEMIERTETHE